jgi:hypothetical protein
MAKTISRSKKTLRVLLIVVVALVAIRLALPYVILHYANKRLATMDGYRGHIKDIDLAIIRGAYQVDSVYLNKVDTATKKETPFFAASLVDLSLEWKALFKGSIVGEIILKDPMLRFTKDKVEPKTVKKDSSDLKGVVDDFMPLKVNRFEARNGRIQYIDENSKPRVDVQLTNANIVALNLRNSYDSSELLPASLKAQADVYGGTLNFTCKLNPLAKDPTFDMNAEIKDTHLVKINDFFKAYANVDVNKGTFGLYTEMAAKNGQFDGYIKPLIKDLDVLGQEDRKDNALQKLWEGLAGSVGQVFKNQSKDRLATKIPLQGSTKQLDTNIWYAIGEVLQNAFVRALQPALDQEINIQTVGNEKPKKKNFLEKIFAGKEDKHKKDKADKKN